MIFSFPVDNSYDGENGRYRQEAINILKVIDKNFCNYDFLYLVRLC